MIVRAAAIVGVFRANRRHRLHRALDHLARAATA
jgi:hypothetical protein